MHLSFVWNDKRCNSVLQSISIQQLLNGICKKKPSYIETMVAIMTRLLLHLKYDIDSWRNSWLTNGKCKHNRQLNKSIIFKTINKTCFNFQTSFAFFFLLALFVAEVFFFFIHEFNEKEFAQKWLQSIAIQYVVCQKKILFFIFANRFNGHSVGFIRHFPK